MTIEEDTVHCIKSMLWDGYQELDLARCPVLRVSLYLIHEVRTGKKFAYIPWPDGSKGEMDKERYKRLRQIENSFSSIDYVFPKENGNVIH